MNDNEYLERKMCPDCGLILYFYFGEIDKPWCKKCDVYFTRLGDWVVRNKNATQEYNRLLMNNEDFDGNTD